MFRLARELQPGVIVTATTHLGAWQTELADKHISVKGNTIEGMEDGFQGVLLITGELEENRTKPVNDELLFWLHRYCRDHSMPLMVEADGSRQKPLKAWSKHEPPIPEFSDLVVQVAGLAGLGMPLTDDFVHRADVFSELGGLEMGQTISIDSIVRVLKHPAGGLKNIPAGARRVVLLNQADIPELQAAAHAMTSALLQVYHSVIVASLAKAKIHAVHEPVAGIILAAGESARFGKPKQLLDWKGQPFVRAVARTAIQAGLSPIIVVTGANAELVEASVSDLNITTVRNENWRSGQGSSIKEGLHALALSSMGDGIGGAVFLLADQPQVNSNIIHGLREKHSEGLYPIVAPMVIDRRGNPVLFDRVTFPDLMKIEGDSGGRAIFHQHRVEYIPWHDDSLLLDVDTPEQYQRLISYEDL